jgi:sterol desaturase/sphingolipid hydroxylase (fatty acid hydroxylase superfamily)
MGNAFFAGVYGTGLFILHINRPFLKFYYELDVEGLGYFFASGLFCYLWIDAYSYWMHKLLHTKWMYKNIRTFLF